MKFSAPVKSLRAALDPAARQAPARSTIPVLAHVLVEASAEAVAFTGNDLDKMVRGQSEAKVETAGSICVAAHILADILRKLAPDGEAGFERADNGLIVRQGRARFVLPTLPAEDFPQFADETMTREFALPAHALAGLIGAVAYAISTEETRYYLNGVFLEALGEPASRSLRAVATDGHRLARCDLELPAGAAGMPSVIVPRLACAEIAKLDAAAQAPVKVGISTGQIRVDFGTLRFASKLVDGTFPDYRRVVPSNPHAVRLDRDAFAAALERVSIIASERGRAVKLAFRDDKLTLSTSNPDGGSAEETIDLAGDAPPVEIGFNARYVLDMIAALETPDLIVDLDNAGAPTVFRDPGRSDRLAVIMPVRV